MEKLTVGLHMQFTEEVIELLYSSGIRTISQFLETETKKIAEITNITHKDVVAIRGYIINKSAAVTRNALDYYNHLVKNSAIIPTGISSLDLLLNGGLATGKIYEVCGLPSAGKTQLCLTLCKNVSLGLQQKLYYIDTKRDFSAKRIKSMLLDRSDEIIGEVLLKILVKQINNKFDLINSLYDIQKEIMNGLKIRLIIIDSLPTLFTKIKEYNVENNMHLNHIVNIMRYLMSECYVTFVVVNLISIWNEGDFKENTLKEYIACGKYWQNIPHVRLKLASNGNISEISVLRSSDFSCNSTCSVKLSQQGVS